MEQPDAVRDAIAAWTPSLGRSLVWAAALGFVVLVAVIQALHDAGATKRDVHGRALPPSYPSWIPFLGHVPYMAIDRESFLSRLRNLYPSGLYAIRLLSKPHIIVYNPSFTSTILNKPESVVDGEFLRPSLLISNFGFSRKDADLYGSLTDTVHPQLAALLTDEGLSFITNATIRHIKKNIADLVTFNSSPADQADWEVRAGAEVVESAKNGSFVELDLFDLVRNFVAKTANQGLLGTDFVDNFPDAWDNLWRYDDGFVLMTVTPAWLPLPRITRAKAAGYKVRQNLMEFHDALDRYLDGQDPGSRWPDLDNVGPLILDRARLFREAKLPIRGRACADLALVWATNANSSPLVSWMIWEIVRDPIILERIREEVAPYVEVVQPENHFGPAVWIAPEVKNIDVNGLVNKCPLLKGAYVETLRLYTAVWNLKYTNEDVVLNDRGKGGESFVVPKDRYVHMPQHIHQFDPAYFPDPMEWHPQRHLRESVDDKGNKTYTASLGTMKPYSGGARMCKGRAFAAREMMIYTAVIVSLYDVQAPDGGTWNIPKMETRSGTRHPLSPLRVWMKRRDIAGEDERIE